MRECYQVADLEAGVGRLAFELCGDSRSRVAHGQYQLTLLAAEVATLDLFQMDIYRLTKSVLLLHRTADPFVPYQRSLQAVREMPTEELTDTFTKALGTRFSTRRTAKKSSDTSLDGTQEPLPRTSDQGCRRGSRSAVPTGIMCKR